MTQLTEDHLAAERAKNRHAPGLYRRLDATTRSEADALPATWPAIVKAADSLALLAVPGNGLLPPEITAMRLAIRQDVFAWAASQSGIDAWDQATLERYGALALGIDP